MNNSPLKYLDYDVSLLLNEYIKKNIHNNSKFFHKNLFNYHNLMILNKLKIKNLDNRLLLIHSFDPNDMIIANTMYYKNLLNKTIKLTSYKIIRYTNSFINDYLFTILNLWIQLYDYFSLNPILPIKHNKLLELIDKRLVFFPDTFNNCIRILKLTSEYKLGSDKLLYYYYYRGYLKPFSYCKFHKHFFKEWCIFYKDISTDKSKNIKLLLNEIINDKYFPNSNDYMIHFQYFKKKYITTDIQKFHYSIYFFNKLWFNSNRDIGYIYHKNSKSKLRLTEDHRYEILKFHKKLFQITNNNYL